MNRILELKRKRIESIIFSQFYFFQTDVIYLSRKLIKKCPSNAQLSTITRTLDQNIYIRTKNYVRFIYFKTDKNYKPVTKMRTHILL